MSEDAVITAKTAYDHLVLTRQIDDETYKVFVDKVDRILNKQLLVFVALGFGLTKIAWVSGNWWWPTIGLGGLAGLALAMAFLIGLHTLRIGHSHVVGVSTLHCELLKKDQITQLSPAEFTKQLAQNLAETIERNRDEARRRDKLMPWLNRLTAFGYIFAAAFLAIVIVGSTITLGEIPNDGQGPSAATIATN